MADQGDRVLHIAEQTRIVAILRGSMGSRALEAMEVLLDTGIRLVEVTMNSAGVLEILAAAQKHFGDRMVMGAGTVTRADDVQRVADAGAKFIVSPNTNPAVIAATRKAALASFPGAFTCSEIVSAVNAGAHAVKLFPMVDASPAYVKAVRAPLDDVRLIPTGGITVANAQGYLHAGSFALGIGSELVHANTFTPEGMAELRKTATKLANLVTEFEQEK